MRISTKLPLAAALFALVSIGTSTGVSLYLEANALKQQVMEKLEATADGRRNEARVYLQSIGLDLNTLASSVTTQQAVFGMSTTWSFLGDDPVSALHQRYIVENPNGPDQRKLLDSAQKDAYDRSHKQYHSFFRDHMEAQEYYDVFLTDTEGNILYSVRKESDFGTNLLTGPYKDSGLGAVVRLALEATQPDQVRLSQFQPYEPSGGEAAAFVAAPVFTAGRIIGAIAYQLPNGKFNALYSNRKGLGETGETILVGEGGTVVNDSVHTPQNDALMVKVDEPFITEALAGQESSGELTGYRDMDSYAAAAPLEIFGQRWAVVALTSQAETVALLWRSALASVGVGIVLILAGCAVAFFYSRQFTRPISRLVESMGELARGRTDIDLTGQDRRDEIGDMARSVLVFREAAIEKLALERDAAERRDAGEAERRAREIERAEEQERLTETVQILGEGLQRLASGDLTATIARPFSSGLDRLRLDFNASLERLASTVASVHANVAGINGKTADMGKATDDLSRRTEQQAASLEETSSAIRQIMDAVHLSSQRAQTASKLAADARGDSDRSSSIVANAVGAMERIESASSEISKIINVIDEIAFQTNLLALNAGVEAARAGEAGKGFAVVAQEVRELAQRSANAAKDIKALITKSGAEVAGGVELVKQTGAVLSSIAGQVVQINDHIHSIASATRQQSVGLNEINAAVGRMEEGTQQNARAAEQTNAGMRALTDDTRNLAELVSQFTIDQASGAPVLKGATTGQRPSIRNFDPGPVVPPTGRGPRIAPVSETARPVMSPARSLLGKLASGLQAKNTPATAAKENWEEF